MFELMPSNGTWTEKLIHSFRGGYDGYNPGSALAFDAAGNLYGTTLWGGPRGGGILFKLIPNLDGTWTEQLLHAFSGGNDGGFPRGAVVFDKNGYLYGTTVNGGIDGNGLVFRMTPTSGDRWDFRVLHGFRGGRDGMEPFNGVVFDTAGNLYGTTSLGGGTGCYWGCGTIFKLTPTSDGKWTYRSLRAFKGGADGAVPYADLTVDVAGNIYGTTTQGGDAGSDCGGGWGAVV